MRAEHSAASARPLRIVRDVAPPPLPLRGDQRILYGLSAAVGALLVAASVAGLLFGTRGLYQPDPALLAAFLAQDAVTLALALPLLIGSMWATRQGSVRGLVLWCAALFYVAYSYWFYVAGARFGPLFLVHVALVGASAWTLLFLVSRIDLAALRDRFTPDLPALRIGLFMMATGALFAAAWVGDVLRRLITAEPLGDVARHVYAIDLVVALPAMMLVGGALARRRPWGVALAGVLLVKLAALMATLLVSSAIYRWWGHAVAGGQVAAYTLTMALALACIAAYMRALRS